MTGDAQDDYDATAHLKGRPTTAERERIYAAAVDHLAWAPPEDESTTTPKEQA